MNTIIRNLLSVLRRFKMATFLNIAGLSVAFAAFLIIIIQVHYEYTFDKVHPTSERIYRVDLASPGLFSVILPRPFVEAVIESSPHIQAGTSIFPFIGPVYLTVNENGEKKGFREKVLTCDPGFVKVFDLPVIEGDPDCLKEPDKLIIPESLSKKFYGEGSAIGKNLYAEESIPSVSDRNFTIGAVYKDLPENTQVRNVIYTAMDPDFYMNVPRASNFVGYILLDDAANMQNVEDNFNRNYDFSITHQEGEEIRLIPLTDIYFKGESLDGMIFRSGNKETPLLLFIIAILILGVAIINFTNFSTALTPIRIKNINTQKVLGNTDRNLRNALLAESILISIISWIIGLLIIMMVDRTSSLPFINADLALQSNAGLVLLSALVALLVGVLAGIYPAHYMVSFSPALVLKGSFGLSLKGRRLRTVLIGVQFVVSIVLIISASMVKLQNEYMKNFSLGFDKDQIAIIELSSDIYKNHHETYVNRLREFNGIEDVAFAMEKVASKDAYSTNTEKYKEKDIQYYMIAVSDNFLRVMGIPLFEGRDFSKADAQSSEASYIFNRSAYSSMEMEAGDPFGKYPPGKLIGFAEDVNFTSLRQDNNNIGFALFKHDYPMKVSYVRIKAGTDMTAAVKHIKSTLSDIAPSYPFDIEFYDDIFNNLYTKEESLRLLITLFSLLAIIISLVGVFGLVVFETQYRRKEIALRRVHGSTIKSILEMLNKQYVYIVTTCFVIAAPIAWLAAKTWLQNFAYKTPIYWWIFCMALFIVMLITLATVTLQSWRVANANPVDSLKSE